MLNMEVGMFAKSLAGHDKKKTYIIIRVEKEYVWVVDGCFHNMENPKKKNKKHIQVIHKISESIRQTILNKQKFTNEQIIEAIQLEVKS